MQPEMFLYLRGKEPDDLGRGNILRATPGAALSPDFPLLTAPLPLFT